MKIAVATGYLRLMRPPNLPTAAADILAGAAITGLGIDAFNHSSSLYQLLYLVLASVSLYAGGVVMNDVFDYELDKLERPERALPSGLISVKNAAFFGVFWLGFGIFSAFLASTTSGFVATILCGAILLYDAYSKKHDFFGPLNMGICRGLNLILGMSTLLLSDFIWLGFIPVIYIFGITLISRGEVHGDNKKNILFSGILYLLVGMILYFLGWSQGYEIMLKAIPFQLIFLVTIYVPLANAYSNNEPKFIKKAVIAGVLSVVLMDAAIAVTFAPWWYGLVIITLLPLSLGLAKLFAVT